MDIQNYPKLSTLISEVHRTHEIGNKTDTLMNILTKNHYWPYIQLKYFSNKSSLVMLHNVYKQDIPIPDKELYNECRSVILDMNAPEGSNIVLSLSKKFLNVLLKNLLKILMKILHLSKQVMKELWYICIIIIINGISAQAHVHPSTVPVILVLINHMALC